MTRLALLVLLVSACAHRLEDLQPYPCASESATCPDGRACKPGVGCVDPYLDGPCDDFTDCSLGGEDLACLGGRCDDPGRPCEVGICAQTCSASVPCPEGRVCTDRSGGLGSCLRDCTLDGMCGRDLACTSLPSTGRFVCSPLELEFPLCSGVQVTFSCSTCGDPFAFDVACPGSSETCTHHSTCAPGSNRCACDEGFEPFNCDEERCGGDVSCSFPSWYCRPPDATLEPSCTQTLFRVSGTCQCVDGATLSFGCGELRSCEEMCNQR